MNDDRPPANSSPSTNQISIDPSSARFGAFVLDTYVCPDLSKLTSCTAPEITEEAPFFADFLLNDLFSGTSYVAEKKVFVSSFVKKMEESIKEYRNAREHLAKYPACIGTGEGIMHIRRALMHFEGSIIRLHLACTYLAGMGKLGGHILFTHGDNSDYDRLRLLNNRIKHFDEDVAKSIKKGAAPPTAPIWLTDTGFECPTAALSFQEFVAILKAQSSDATSLTRTIYDEARQRRTQNTPSPG